MNTVEALKELYKSFGGKLTDTYDDIADGIPVGNYSVIPDCFAALAEIAGGSIELPVVTQADAGDVLTVGEDGKWTNAEPAKELPTVTASDNGSVLSVVNGAWAKGLKIKKKTISATADGTQQSLSFKVNSSNQDVTNPILGYCFTLASIQLLPGQGASCSSYTQTTSGYGNYARNIIVNLNVPAGGKFPQGTYELDVYYIDLA